jgi:sugar phosphate isomerase/epimerase
MNREQLAINSVSTIRAGLEESLAAYHQAGFRYVEFPLHHVRDDMAQGRTLDDVRGLLRRYELQCIGGFDCGLECFTPQARRAQNHARIIDNARFLAALGGTMMVVGTDGPRDGGLDPAAIADPLGDMAAVFAQVADAIADTGVTLCIEFNWSPYVKSLRTAAEIARRSGRPNVGVLFDPAHYYCTPTKFAQLTAENVAVVRHVHVDDMRDKPPELSNCNSDRVLPGQGILDLPALLGRLEQHGYDRYFSIELFNEELWAMPAAEAARLMYDSLLSLCEA